MYNRVFLNWSDPLKITVDFLISSGWGGGGGNPAHNDFNAGRYMVKERGGVNAGDLKICTHCAISQEPHKS
jgi:hypothetical protein